MVRKYNCPSMRVNTVVNPDTIHFGITGGNARRLITRCSAAAHRLITESNEGGAGNSLAAGISRFRVTTLGVTASPLRS